MTLYLISIAMGIVTLVMVMKLGLSTRKELDLGPGSAKLTRSMSFLEKYYPVFFGLLLVLFWITRLAYLGFIPKGMHIDEIGMSYDAYSLANYGMDRHQVHYPVYLENFGGGQSALYAYVTSLFLRFFPYSTTLVRLPAVIFGFFCFLASFFLVKDVVRDLYTKSGIECCCPHAIALAGPLFVTIIPYFLMSERWALDCNLFLCMGTVSLCFLVKAITSRKKLMCLIAGISCGITLYTYAISYLVLPLFFILLFAYLVYLRKKDISLSCLVTFCIPVGLLGLPLVVFQLVNMGLIKEFTIFGSQFKPLYSYRVGELSFNRAIPKLLYVVKAMIGADELSYNGFHEFGPVYLCMVPLVVYGAFRAIADLVISIKKRTFAAISVVVLYFFSCWGIMLLHGFCYNAINHIYITFLVFAVYGLVYLGRTSAKSILVSLSVIGISFALFSFVYFVRQNDMIEKHDFFYDMTQGEIVAYAEEKYDPQGSKMLYISYDPEEQDQQNLIASLYGKVPAPIWGQITKKLGSIYMAIPDEIDPSEDAVYIIGRSQTDTIEYLLSMGYKKDDTYEKDTILYKE